MNFLKLKYKHLVLSKFKLKIVICSNLKSKPTNQQRIVIMNTFDLPNSQLHRWP